MKISIRKNKLLFVNSILIIISFVLLLIFLLFPNTTLPESSSRIGILPFQLYYFSIIFWAGNIDLVDFILWLVVHAMSVILFLISLVYIIKSFILIIKKDEIIKISKILFYQSCYIILVIHFLIIDLTLFDRNADIDLDLSRLVYPNLAICVLTPFLCFLVYNLISTIVYINKIKKKETIETR